MYKYLIRPILFLFDPELVHHFSFRILRGLLSVPLLASIFGRAFTYQHPDLEREMFGLRFRNPVGLAAGFDKDALIADKWRYLGFGFVELGTVTPRPQSGNPRKRLFRLPADKAIINRMGFNNAGVDAMVERLKSLDKGPLIIGANIGKNKDTPNEQAVEDYRICFEKLFDYVDYFVVNVSSPNTPGLRALQEKEPLTALLKTLQQLNRSRPNPKPLLLKIAPDLSDAQLDDIVEVCSEAELSGLILTNTTISREGLRTPADRIEGIGPGGLSGAPLQQRAEEVLAYVHDKTRGKLPLIGVGGIANGGDARSRIEAGASLVQVYTGFVYEGPSLASRLCKSLAGVKGKNLSTVRSA